MNERTEHTRPGPVFTPAVDIFETEKEITVLADMPGVKAKDLTIDLHNDVLTLTGRVVFESSESEISRELRAGTYVRQFSISEAIDQSKIEATIQDGVLRLELPKVEKARPRQIAVKTAS